MMSVKHSELFKALYCLEVLLIAIMIKTGPFLPGSYHVGNTFIEAASPLASLHVRRDR